MHVTRQFPKRAEELLDGGSLYWVIKGQITARQTLIELREVSRNGVPHCGLIYDKQLVPVRPGPGAPSRAGAISTPRTRPRTSLK